MNDGAPDASSRFPWPPAIYGGSALLGMALHWTFALPFAPDELATALRYFGYVVIAIAIVIGLAAEWKFFRAGTATLPTSVTTALVTTGIYGWTRNPMYLAMTLALAALTLALNDLWFALLTPGAVLAVTRLAIKPEEDYLDRKFGAPYREYCRMVGRWL